MPDMIVNLYDISPEVGKPKDENIRVVRLFSSDLFRARAFVAHYFRESWVCELESATYKPNPTCFVAIKDDVEIVGFACYDSCAKGVFGPIGIRPDMRSQGVGKILLLKCLNAMREDGYAYAAIGGVNKARVFYEKSCNAVALEMFQNSIYSRMTNHKKEVPPFPES